MTDADELRRALGPARAPGPRYQTRHEAYRVSRVHWETARGLEAFDVELCGIAPPSVIVGDSLKTGRLGG